MELCLAGAIRVWASPAMMEEYQEVLAEHPDFLQRIVGFVEPCFPLTELEVIRHQPDNRFLECALAVPVDFIVTVNTARGHFDQAAYQNVPITTPGSFLKLPAVEQLVRKHLG